MSISHVNMQLACRTKALSLTTTLSTAFSRASTATYTDVNGVVQTAAIDIPRNAHYVSGVSTVLTEAAGTNNLLYSRDLTNAAWAVSNTSAAFNAVGLDGTSNSATTVTDASAGAIGFIRQIPAAVIANDTAQHTCSVWIKKDTDQTRFVGVFFYLTGGTGVNRGIHLNTQTGAVTSVSTNGTSTFRAVDGGLWWVVEIVCTNNTSGNTGTKVEIYPAIGTVFGANSAAATGSCVVGHAQMEYITSAYTSPIFTTTVAVTRSADVGSIFSATAQGYARDTGSFLTDNYEIGAQIRPVGFTNTVPDTLTNVTALTLTTRSSHPVEAGLLGRNFTVGLPSDFAWENVRFTPTQGVPYVKEEYLPGPMSLNSFGTGGDITVEPTYRLTVFVPQNAGISADGAYADALLNLFAPSTEMLLPDGNVLFVRADVAPIRGQRTQQQGLTGIPVTIPLRALISNATTTNPFYVVFTDSAGDIAIESSISAALAQYQLVTISSDGDVLAP